MSRNQPELGRTEPEAVRSTLSQEAGDLYEDSMEAKKGNYLLGYSLKPSWLFVIGGPSCCDLVTLRHLKA